MDKGVKLGQIPTDKYADYRLDVIFSAYKWDPQVGDYNTVSPSVVLLDKATASKLEAWAERLAKETVEMEKILYRNLKLAKTLGIPKKNLKAYNNSTYQVGDNVRLMRFDFHPTTDGWAVSEVNSDVPGGLAESSLLPHLAAPFFEGYNPAKNTAEHLFAAFRSRIASDNASPVAFVHATAYSDDRQVMQFLGDYFESNGINAVMAAPDHIKWINNKPYFTAGGKDEQLAGIVRFYPLEWLPLLPRGSNWQGYYSAQAPSCNHPAALLTQSKRLPLIWDKLGVDLTAWKQLLPQTIAVKQAKDRQDFIFKPAFGRVGEGISIKDAISKKEFSFAQKQAKRHSKHWVAQQKFDSLPLAEEGSPRHLCIGVFTVDGKSAGFYGRISRYPRIDGRAEDIPVLVSD